MKKCVLLIFMAAAVTLSLFSLSKDDAVYRALDISKYHQSNNVALRASNFGFFGSGSNRPQWPSLEYPAGSGIDYLFQGAVWVSGKKVRRDTQGRRMFWIPEPENQNDVVAEGTTAYQELINDYGSLKLAVDTLTTVGFDGDASLYELLPAYNPLEMNALGEQYSLYNPEDRVLRSILGYPSPADETFPLHPTGIYLFSQPTDQTGDFPGIETLTSYYYDYSPFGTPGKRNYGASATQFDHYSLGLAVRQQTYAWTFQDLYDMIFFSFEFYNTNPYDTLYDIALAMYMDHDIGPQAWDGDARSLDDVSGYYAGEGYEFAYSRDYDGDDGLSIHWVATKLFPKSNWDFACFNWGRSSGPDDRQPRRLDPRQGQITSNEKYWLMTGRNPDPEKFNPLRPLNWTPDQFPHYEEAEPNDTRFLYTIYGDMQGFYEPTENTINIPPGEKITVDGVIFFGDDLDHLKERSLIAQEFYDSGYDLSLYEGVPAMPVIKTAVYDEHAITVEWFTGSGADEQYLYYKQAEQPASQWQEIVLDTDIDSYVISEIDLYYVYQIKVAAVYDGVYLESTIREVLASPVSVEQGSLLPKQQANRLLSNYPNPFNPDTYVVFALNETKEISLEIYNVKGQLVRTLVDSEAFPKGINRVYWNGKDDDHRDAGSGVYLYRLRTTAHTSVKRMIMVK